LEKELKQIQTDMDTRQMEIKALQQYVQKSKEELQRLEQQLKEQKVSVGVGGSRNPGDPRREPWFACFASCFLGKQQTPFTTDHASVSLCLSLSLWWTGV
jgi:hypothetical protein